MHRDFPELKKNFDLRQVLAHAQSEHCLAFVIPVSETALEAAQIWFEQWQQWESEHLLSAGELMELGIERGPRLGQVLRLFITRVCLANAAQVAMQKSGSRKITKILSKLVNAFWRKR